ncbi:MAG: hypothetical protein AAFX94_25705, partial [Myxococcota bacterium]
MKDCIRLTNGDPCAIQSPPPERTIEACAHPADNCSINPYRLDYTARDFECLEEACVPVWSDQATMVDLASSVECKEGPPRQSSVTVTGTESRCVNRTANQCSFAGARIQTSRQCTEGSPDEVTLTTELPCQLAVEDRPLGDTC